MLKPHCLLLTTFGVCLCDLFFVGEQDVGEVWRRSCPWCWPIYCQELSFISSVCGSVDTYLQSNIHHLQECPNDAFLPPCRGVHRNELYDRLQVPPKVRETAQVPLNIEPSCTHTCHICIDARSIKIIVLYYLWETSRSNSSASSWMGVWGGALVPARSSPLWCLTVWCVQRSRVHKKGWLEYSSHPFLCTLAKMEGLGMKNL